MLFITFIQMANRQLYANDSHVITNQFSVWRVWYITFSSRLELKKHLAEAEVWRTLYDWKMSEWVTVYLSTCNMRNEVSSGGIFFTWSVTSGGFTGRYNIINIIEKRSNHNQTRLSKRKLLSFIILFTFHNWPHTTLSYSVSTAALWKQLHIV